MTLISFLNIVSFLTKISITVGCDNIQRNILFSNVYSFVSQISVAFPALRGGLGIQW